MVISLTLVSAFAYAATKRKSQAITGDVPPAHIFEPGKDTVTFAIAGSELDEYSIGDRVPWSVIEQIRPAASLLRGQSSS